MDVSPVSVEHQAVARLERGNRAETGSFAVLSGVEVFRDGNSESLHMIDTSILHHAFISIFIALWAVITHYISILMAILSYFTRFTMKRGNAGSWNSGWERRKRWKPILHSSKSPETPRNNFLDLIRISERKK